MDRNEEENITQIKKLCQQKKKGWMTDALNIRTKS